MEKRRVEYIDALRGFCMILVVMYHVGMFSYGMALPKSYYHVFNFFMLPLFFFVSGWCCYRTDIRGIKMFYSFCRNKFNLLIIPSIIFMLLSIYVFHLDAWNTVFNEWKAGYWFTVVLFFFFFLYAIIQWTYANVHLSDKLKDILLWVLAFLVFCASLKPVGEVSGLFGYLYNGLSISQWWYFLFFIIGVLVRKHFDKFVDFTNNQYVVASFLVVFSMVFLFRNEIASISYGINVLVLGFTGTVFSFTFFRKQQALFSKDTILGRILQLIGKRTLDIYMIHYFILPRHLDTVGRFFQLADNPVIEFFLSILISAGVISVCLLFSGILRLSPWLAHVMLGAKDK